MAIPAGATATWAVGLEARRPNVALTTSERKLGHIGPTSTFNEFGINPVSYFTVSGTGKATARRVVVKFENCNVCHETLSVHGGTRHDPQYCVMCHTPDNTDIARRPTGGAAAAFDLLPERSIHLKPMIHSIHTGENLQTQVPFLIYGFGGSLNFFDEVRFPSSRANCKLCHVPNSSGAPSYTIDSLEAAGPAGALPSRAFQIGPSPTSPQTTFPFLSCGGDTPNSPVGCTPVGPITVTCMACHDSPTEHAHAQAMTEIPIGSAPSAAAMETCAICHGENSEFAVTRVHATAASRNPEP
jgi:OmcA/MtrC family decaheme c-type cytochrome